MNEHYRKRVLAGIVLGLGTVLLFQFLPYLSPSPIVQRSGLRIKLAQTIHDTGIRVSWAENILAAESVALRAQVIAYMNTTLKSGEWTGGFFVPQSEQPLLPLASDHPVLHHADSPKVLRDAGPGSNWVQNLLAGDVWLSDDDFHSLADPPLTPP